MDDKWNYLKNHLLGILDKIAPLRKITIQDDNKFPWFNLELYKARHLRDVLYAKAKKNNPIEDWDNYRQARLNFKEMNKWHLFLLCTLHRASSKMKSAT